MLSEHVPAAERPSALGLRLTVNQGTQFVVPLALGAVAQFSGYGPMFVFAGVLLLVVSWALLARLPAYVRLARSEAG